VHQPPSPVVTASARPPQQRTKNPLKQQHHKGTSSNQHKDTSTSNQTKKLYDCVERPPSIQNNITTTTAPITTRLSSDKETMMILQRSREFLGNTNQSKHATSSSSTWHEVGIFRQSGGSMVGIFRQEGVDYNSDDAGKGNGQSDGSMAEEERLLFQSVRNSIPKKQVVEQKKNNDAEVIVIDDDDSDVVTMTTVTTNNHETMVN